MRNLNNFNWGWMDKPTNRTLSSGNVTKSFGQWHKDAITKEIFEDKLYEKFFTVEEGDIVMDFGSSVGPFTYSILDNKPKHVYCIEPSPEELETLILNTSGGPVTIINKGISDQEGEFEFNLFGIDDGIKMAQSTTFDKIKEEYNITKIDFIKTDCEGGEYSIFNNKNFFWIKENVKKIVGEWHLETPEKKQQFRVFRDTYLRLFPNIQVFSVDGCNIKWDLWSDHFLNYYFQVIIYIDNRD
jgi:FkbM family methyltransferase